MLKAIEGLLTTLQAGSESEKSSFNDIREQHKLDQKEAEEEIDACLAMAVECGATEDTDEYFMATELFRDKYDRKIFQKFKTNEGKLGWLNRKWRMMRGN
jgi:hypothetical protein